MPTDAKTSLDVAERFFAAIASADIEAVRTCYAPDARIWHNVGGEEQGVEENLRLLGWVTRNTGDYRYEDVRRQASEEGFIQQHVLRGTNRKGHPVEVPACVVARVSDGRITRIDEYIDSAASGVLFA
ncbi:MAG: nuclear transport factor 2 family protein [Dehalococcoidia bacterium]|nr:nuclear transport factor 2 family protein [Dehalococcoidia bacterium]